MAKFKVNDQVYLPKLKKFAVVIEIIEKSQRLKLALGSLTLEYRQSDVLSLDQAPKRTRKSVVTPEPKSKTSGAMRIDLHAHTVEEAVRRTEQAVNDAIMANAERLEIMHGLGTGKVKNAVHKTLERLSVVADYKLDSANPGVTLVYF